MEVSMSALAVSCLYALVLGVFLGAVYDVVRIIRVILRVTPEGTERVSVFRKMMPDANRRRGFFGKINSDVLTALGDILYFIISAVIFILFLYCVNNGIFRWFILFFTVIGFLVYYHSVGRAVMSVSWFISDLIRFSLYLLWRALSLPFIRSFEAARQFVSKVICPFYRDLKKSIDNKKRRMYTDKCIDRLYDFVRSEV